MKPGRESCWLFGVPVAILVAAFAWLRPSGAGEDAARDVAERTAVAPVALRNPTATPGAGVRVGTAAAPADAVRDLGSPGAPARDFEQACEAVILGVDGKPLAGAKVRVLRRARMRLDDATPLDPDDDGSEEMVSDADGRVRFVRSFDATYALEVTADGHGRKAFAFDGPHAVQVVRLAAPVTCSGRVLDADGNPVAGAVIVLHDGFSEAMSCVTDAFGLYRFEGVGEGSFRLAASHRVLQSGMKAVQAEAGGDARIDFQLPLGAAFAGSARGADGAVFDDGYAELYDRWTRERVDAVPLGPSGAFRFASLYPGRDYVVAVTSGFASGEFAAVGGAVGGGAVEVSADGSVTAYAYDFDGDPIVGAAMRLAREDGLAAYGLEADHITGADGSTTWHGLRSGVNYRLIARAPGKAALEVRGIRFDEGHAAVALPPEAPVEGVVTNADGDPLAGVTVRVLRRDALAAPALYTTTDGDGRFTLRGAASGEVTVSALRVGYVVASTPVTLPPQGVSGLLFMLQAVPD